MKGIIYKATNRQDGKIYIGQTIQTLEKRIRCHVGTAKKRQDSPFYKALNAVGPEGFDWEVIETVEVDVPPSMEEAGRYLLRPELLEAESRHIVASRAYQPEVGYNVTAMGIPGGLSPEKTNTSYRVVLYRISNGKRFRVYGTLKAAVLEMGWSLVHNRLIKYDPAGIRLIAPKHVRYVAVKIPKSEIPPEIISVERSQPIRKGQRSKGQKITRQQLKMAALRIRREELKRQWREKDQGNLRKLQKFKKSSA